MIPLVHWADAQMKAIARITGSPAIAALSGARILGMRAANRAQTCRFHKARDGYVALNLARPDDMSLLPALFGNAHFRLTDLPTYMARSNTLDIVARGRELGLAIAHLDEKPVGPPCEMMTEGIPAAPMSCPLRVIDLSSLWAGPLTGHLLGCAGSEVIKVESSNRPDAMRHGDPLVFSRLNDGKSLMALDLRTESGRCTLEKAIRCADVVIEAARPRALQQLGVDANLLVCEVPGLVWITITGHGIASEAANWIGYGDDTGVAGGLSAAYFAASGKISIVGDAIGDPLTGIYAARMALEQRNLGNGARLALSMSAVVAKALAETEAPFASC